MLVGQAALPVDWHHHSALSSVLINLLLGLSGKHECFDSLE